MVERPKRSALFKELSKCQLSERLKQLEEKVRQWLSIAPNIQLGMLLTRSLSNNFDISRLALVSSMVNVMAVVRLGHFKSSASSARVQ